MLRWPDNQNLTQVRNDCQQVSNLTPLTMGATLRSGIEGAPLPKRSNLPIWELKEELVDTA